MPVTEYIDAIARELVLRYPEGTWTADSLYLGGGTPSRLGAEGVARLLGVLRERIELAPGAEVTLEANPDDITPAAVQRWREAGVGRLSVGAQSFDPRVLAWMHRTHSTERIAEAVAMIRDGGIENWSIDLIFSLPAALERDWARDVELARALEPPHISLYGLTIEAHTPLGRWYERGDVAERDDEGYEAEYLHADRALVGAGYEHYEVSNFALPGLRSRHNSSYWRGVPYAGLGPSAHGFDGTTRRWNIPAYEAWRQRVEQGADPVEGSETLSTPNRIAEEVYLGLRTDAGLRLRSEEEPLARRWMAEGWACRDGDQLRLTPLGWLRLDALAVALTSGRSC